MSVRGLKMSLPTVARYNTATSLSSSNRIVTYQAFTGAQSLETPNNTKFVLIEEIIFISKIKHGENILFCGRKLNKWKLGKISYM